MPTNSINPDTKSPSLRKSQWHKDNEHDKCELCENKFTFFNRRHHCRNCGRVICRDCQTTYNTVRGDLPILVCKLCLNCAINGDKCQEYMTQMKLTDRKFIPADFSFNGVKVDVNDTLTIIPEADRLNITARVISLETTDKPECTELDAEHAAGNEGGPKIKLVLITKPAYYDNMKDGENFYLVNLADNSEILNSEDKSRIVMKRTIDSYSLGFVDVQKVEKNAQSGGYKYSKRKSKRSVKRRVSKRSTVRCTKVTKRLRKSSRRRMRR